MNNDKIEIMPANNSTASYSAVSNIQPPPFEFKITPQEVEKIDTSIPHPIGGKFGLVSFKSGGWFEFETLGKTDEKYVVDCKLHPKNGFWPRLKITFRIFETSDITHRVELNENTGVYTTTSPLIIKGDNIQIAVEAINLENDEATIDGFDMIYCNFTKIPPVQFT